MALKHKVLFSLVALLVVVSVIATACAAPAPQVVEKVITQVVEKEKVVEKPVVQTQVVEKQVVQTQVVTVKETVVAPAEEAACPTRKDKYKVGFANLTEDIIFTQLVRQGIEEEAKKAGVELVLADNKLDGATALANADNFLLQGVNGVIEFQTDEKFGNVIMDKFRAANVPVIAIDIPMPGATFFGADNYRAGYMAGEAAAKWVNENWEGSADAILVLELPQSGPVAAARMQGQLEGVQNNLKTKVPEDMVFRLDSKNTQDEAFRVVSDTLPKIPNAKKVVAVHINDGTTLGTIAAFEAAGRKDQVIAVSQGADPSGQDEMVKEGSRYLGATGYFPEKYGSKIVPAIIDLMNCKPVPPAIYVDHVFINKDNLCEIYSEHKSCK